MFLTLDSAWKLLAIAFYGLLTFNSVAWAQITPVPGGVSSIENKSNLSSSTSSSFRQTINSGSGSKIIRPLLARRPEPELPPVPPTPAYASKEASAFTVVQASEWKPAQKAEPTLPTLAPVNQAPSAQVPTPAQLALAQPSLSTNDKFMLDLESDLSNSAPTAAAEPQTMATSSKNSALNPTHGKSFVVQASASGDGPPTPPSPSTPPLSTLMPTPVQPAIKPALPAKSAAVLPEPKPTQAPKAKSDPGEPNEFFPANDKPAVDKPAPDKPAAQATAPKSETATHLHLSDQPRSQRPPGVANVIAGNSNKTIKPSLLTALGKQTLESIEFDDVPLADAMKLFSEQSGLNVITSTEAGKARVTVFLKQVTALDALEAIVKANGLFYRVEEASGIVRIATSKEYEKDLSSFREEQTRVFTLLYPNPIAVAQVIQQVFGNRVRMNRADADVDDLVDLSRRFNRFDMVDGRSLGLGGANNANGGGRNGMNNGNGLNGNGLNGNGLNGNGNNALSRAMGGGNGLNGNSSSGGMNNQPQLFNNTQDRALLNDLSSDEIQRLENELAQQGNLNAESQADLLERRDATIYISTIRRNNQIIVRTGDNRSMDQIAQLITQLDVPTPTVLLEVKVLRIVLADGFNSAFEYFGATGNASTAMSDGALQPAFPGANAAARTLGAGLGVAGGVPGSLSFQMVDDKFRVRMQMLESKNCVTALATPLILTANNEVSRIFVGDTLPFTVGFTPSQVLSSVTAVNGAVAATPVTELRDVGQSLLITPNINADRTVTLRVIEENSERVVAGSSIPVPATSGTGVTNINVDTVRRRTISGTIVAQDGMAVALGGLIEEQVHDSRDQVPVLGNIPGLGLLFRRQASGKSRSELVVIVRPYVFNTPTESAATTEMLLGELTTHPNSPEVTGTMNALPCPVTRSESESSQRAKLFQLHNRSLSPN